MFGVLFGYVAERPFRQQMLLDASLHNTHNMLKVFHIQSGLEAPLDPHENLKNMAGIFLCPTNYPACCHHSQSLIKQKMDDMIKNAE